jgi:two-component SAPR family response regulator
MIRETRLNATLEFSLDSYRLSGQGLLTDAELFEHRCREAAEEWDDTQLQQVDWTLNLYRGHYLEERDYPWARVRRDQLLQLFLQLVLKTARCEMAQGRVRQAILRLMRTLDIEPGAEEACQLLMRAYGELGDYAGLQRCYATLVQFLRNELAVEPQPQTQECYAGLMSANSRTSLT